jgi:hypothetical protein
MMTAFTDTSRYGDLVEAGVPFIQEAFEKSGADDVLSEFLAARVALQTLRRAARRFDETLGVPWDRFAVSAMTNDLEKQVASGIFVTDEELVLDALLDAEDHYSSR